MVLNSKCRLLWAGSPMWVHWSLICKAGPDSNNLCDSISWSDPDWYGGRREQGNKCCSVFFLPWLCRLNTYQLASATHYYLELPFATDISQLTIVFISLNSLSFVSFFKQWNVSKLIFSITIILSLPSLHNFSLLQMLLLCNIISRIDITLQNCPYFSLT